jgi:hypothetical protein
MAILSFYPIPDDPTISIPGAATVSPRGWMNNHQGTGRVDWVQSGGLAFLRVTHWAQSRFDPFDPLVAPTNVPGYGSSTGDHATNVGTAWSRSFDSFANGLRFSVNSVRNSLFHENQGTDVSAALGIEGLTRDPKDVGRPGVILGVTDDLMEPFNAPQDGRHTVIHLADTLTIQTGRHTAKIGGEARLTRSSLYFDLYARGQFVFVGVSGNPVADLLLGSPFIALRQDPTKNTDTRFRSYQLAGFVQDTWRLGRITLDTGLRYDFGAPPWDAENRLSVPRFESPQGGFAIVGRDGIPRAGYPSDRNNFAPRISASWVPDESLPISVRGGYGVFYDFPIQNMNLLPRFNPPQFGLDLAVFPGSLRRAFEGPTLPATQIFGIDPLYRDPYYHHRNVMLQLGVHSNGLAEVGYVGSTGRNLIRWLDVNQGPEGGPAVRNPQFGPARVVASNARSSYHSLQGRLQFSFAGHLWNSTYTWSRSRDTASALFGAQNGNSGAPQNSYDLEAEWGPSDFDVPHRFVSFWALNLKPLLKTQEAGRWQLTGVFTAQSGRPFSVFYGESANYSGTSNGSNRGPGLDRPNQIREPRVGEPSVTKWFDSSAFSPPDKAFGTVARNVLRGDDLVRVDLALTRAQQLSGRLRGEFRMEVFNALNTPHFYLPISDLTNALAGHIVRAYDGRQVQFSARFEF